MQLSPYIIVSDVEEAAQFYQKTFGGVLKRLNEHEGKLLHAELEITTGVTLHLSSNYGKPIERQGYHLILTFDQLAEQQRIYEALSEAGDPHMPLQKTFFGAIHGQVTDRYGINWLMNYFE
ncbi:VOC family protein [Staphylococcus delphini]|uniref:VOC family protein n=1 Tax=Staphylococcus delphini TaxID=53344 RepID=A0A2A4GW52_9STAP|nr:VOC family protein [Staphylococcus delphini]MBZ8174407.1 VOC family protein [Staphylococcus delphini]PCF54486.1 VOC family protein [Staphylococcus delphini]PCF60602.1 VOC family protein [Staphylococcus delphini]PCF71062.1 VOC family protein [Staphylococcus delphini]HEC2158158.1 VOC family protein [Staphylococcus delphini]